MRHIFTVPESLEKAHSWVVQGYFLHAHQVRFRSNCFPSYCVKTSEEILSYDTMRRKS
jgi:hypothetical protein